VTAAVAVRLAHQGRLALAEPLDGQLAPELLHRWPALQALPRTTPHQLLAHTSGLPDYFTDEAFAARLPAEPGRAWHRPSWWTTRRLRTERRASPARCFEYCDTGYVVAIRAEPLAGHLRAR
jgi:D-alanyl-D-alanine carboxypeptidase